uniref:Reverse transcriptase domain-containing protein n=1 Tax=Scophthalmus maximus TaxID=52904 RepID=A0A8D3E0A7_SCOMX
ALTINNLLQHLPWPLSSPSTLTPLPLLPTAASPSLTWLPPPPEISKLISSSKSTTCSLDPLPTPLLKSCLPVLCPYLTNLFNSSLSHGTFPSAFKTAAVTPILKKPGLDPSSLNNYRPISNLPFLSKTLECIVATQLQSHHHANKLFEPLQSGFRLLHSTETALLKVLNDLLTSADSGSLNILILLDLRASLDTVSHDILLTRLRDFGNEGTALSWLQSYLTNRSHFNTLHNHTSASSTVTRGVPQGSVLGPLLFITYILPLGQILRHFNLDFHCYADNTQIYLSTKSPHNPRLSHIDSCLSAIKTWMQHNFLKLNSDKTECLLIGSKSTLGKINNPTLTIDGTTVSPSPQAHNLGVIFDSTLSLEPHIRHIVKTSFFHLRNIAKIRPTLTPLWHQPQLHQKAPTGPEHSRLSHHSHQILAPHHPSPKTTPLAPCLPPNYLQGPGPHLQSPPPSCSPIPH